MEFKVGQLYLTPMSSSMFYENCVVRITDVTDTRIQYKYISSKYSSVRGINLDHSHSKSIEVAKWLTLIDTKLEKIIYGVDISSEEE